MALFGKGRRMAARLEAAENQRKYVTRLARKPYHARPKTIVIKKTPAERKVLAASRTSRREKLATALSAARAAVTEEARKLQEEFGTHDEKYFEHQILQQARVTGTKRKVNIWNAFIHAELEEWNKDLPEGAPRTSACDPEFLAYARQKWKTMPMNEKATLSTKLLKNLEAIREVKALAVQNVPINSFHDVRGSANTIFEELRRLHARTGLEVALIAVKSARDQHTPPMTFGTSNHAQHFFELSLGLKLDDVAASFEAYCLSGVSGLVERSMDIIQGLQARVANLIMQKLSQITNFSAQKMFYPSFGIHITSRFGIVLENWPVPRFIAPSAIRTRLELDVLLNAWDSGTTRFRKLTKVEWERWERQQSTAPAEPGESESSDTIHAVTFASTVTPAKPANTSEDSTQATTATTGAVATPVVLPDPKPRRRRADHGKTHKKHKRDTSPVEEARTAPAATQSAPTGGGTVTSVAATPPSGSSVRSTGNATASQTLAAVPQVAPSSAMSFMPSFLAPPPPLFTPPPLFPSAPPFTGPPLFPSAPAFPSAPIFPSAPPFAPAPPTTSAPGHSFASAPSFAAAPSPEPFATGASAAFPMHGGPGSHGRTTFVFPPSYAFSAPPGPSHGPPSATSSNGAPHEWHMPPPFAIDPALSSYPPGEGPAAVNTSTSAVMWPATPPASTSTDSVQFLQYNPEAGTSKGGRGGRGGRGRGGRGKR
ncbi:hypothetical protein TRAPUB_2013 [Trametes pubescens]|uniref:Uncharacterized protein n=1 Tax=Trametes pubescens TaxID=154538 RepID=A0A1M2VHR9_TRAPU|nr:hypothetical protein TRAPUB_2013 [Trametes pubescens]